ncbi:uncharacterized protein LOC144472456 [Augochlora pura]
MDDKGCLSSELETIIDEFSRIRDAYLGLKAFCDVQGEVLMMEKRSSSKLTEKFEKLSESYTLLDKRCALMTVKFNTEKQGLLKTIEELKEQCDHLRLVAMNHNGDDGQVNNLENDIAALKAELVLQTTKHTEEIAVLKQAHSDELLRYHMLLQNAKLAAASDVNKQQKRQKKSLKIQSTGGFRWPELTIEKISAAPKIAEVEKEPLEEVASKKRKLYRESDEDAISLL